MDVDVSDPKEQRNFGLVVAGLFALFCGVSWWRHGELRVWMLVVAALFAVLGLAAPAALRPIFFVWMKIAGAMNWFVTHLLLTVCFCCMITPARILIRWFGTDPLRRKWAPDQATYWEEPDAQPTDLDAYKNQF